MTSVWRSQKLPKRPERPGKYRKPWAGVPLRKTNFPWRSDDAFTGRTCYLRSRKARELPLGPTVAAQLTKDPAVIPTPRAAAGIRPVVPRAPGGGHVSPRLSLPRQYRPAMPQQPRPPGSGPGRGAGRFVRGRSVARTPSALAQRRARTEELVLKALTGGAGAGHPVVQGAANNNNSNNSSKGGAQVRGPSSVTPVPPLRMTKVVRIQSPSSAAANNNNNSGVETFRATAAADARQRRHSRRNSLLAMFSSSQANKSQVAQSENGRMAAESFFRYARPWGGQPAISYPSRTSVFGNRFNH